MVGGVCLMGVVACSPLEPILDPEMSDLQLTVDTLRSSLRDAQRTIGELQTEIERQRRSYGEVQILRAQLEGSSREAEGRLIEARRVIDLQREELAVARSEREQMGQTEAALQGQLRQLRKQQPKIGKQARGAASPAAMISQQAERLDVAKVTVEPEVQADDVDEPATRLPSANRVPVPMRSSVESGHEAVSIQSGDTLWSLARQYQTSVLYLMAINGLIDDRIYIGQTIRVPQPPLDAREYEELSSSVMR